MRPTRVARAVTVVAVLTAIGCGEEQTEGTQRPERADASASPFCDASRQWAVHEMTPIDESDPKAIEAHFKDYAAFIDKSIATAPPAVADDWKVYGNAIRTIQLPVLKKYGYSYEKVGAKGTGRSRTSPCRIARLNGERIWAGHAELLVQVQEVLLHGGVTPRHERMFA